MIRKAFILFLMVALLPVLVYSSTTGKIAGTIKDKETGEPLMGANISIEGTFLGASTDKSGFFVILNVPVGRHNVRVSYMGYQTVLQEDVRTSVDLTTQLNVSMMPQALEGETVVVTAERRMIRKDETNTNVIRTAEEIDQLPIRGMQNLSATIAGVVKQDNSNVMNIRGGRGNENAVYVDGVLVNDPYNSAVRVDIPNEAIEEMSVQTGGFNAEYGEAMSGVVIMTTNSGTKQYHGSIQAITDGFLDEEEKTLGTYSYGYNEYTATLGGPIYPGAKHTFFGSVARKWIKDGAPSWGWAENDNKPDQFKGGVVPGQIDQSWSYTGKVKLQLMKSMELKGSVVWTDRTYSYNGLSSGMNPIMLFDVAHAPQTRTEHRSYNATLTHTLSPTTFYDLKFNYFDSFRKTYDRYFEDDLLSYGDPSYTGDPDWADNWGVAYTKRLEPDFFKPGCPYDDYFKNHSVYWGVDLDMTHQLNKYNTFKLGGEYKYHTLREFRVIEPVKLATDNIEHGTVEYYRFADVRNYGYDVNGNEVDSGDYLEDVTRNDAGSPTSGWKNQAPYHPITMSAYIQDKVEFEDLVLNLGLRYDYIDPNAWQFKQIEADFNADGSYVEGTGMFGGDRIFDSKDVIDSDSYSYISPRLGLSFPVSDKTIFHGQFGQFYQKPDLADLYLSPFYLDAFVARQGYFTTLTNPNLRPMKTTSYEIGFKQMLSDNSSLQLTAFYKETEDNIQVLNVTTDITNIAFTSNGDFGTIKGFDIIYSLRRTKNLSANLNYEYQVSKGTGDASGANFDIAWLGGSRGNFPKYMMPLGFEQRHRGTINVDYRMGEDEGPMLFGIYPLEKLGINLLASFNSGHPYTKTVVQNTQPHDGRYDNDISNTPVSAVLSETTPWVYRFDLKVDKTIKLPLMDTRLNIYMWVLNLFNTEPAVYVWNTTGLPDQTGYLKTTAGQAYYNSLTTAQQQDFGMREMDYTNYGNPRQIRLGVQVEF